MKLIKYLLYMTLLSATCIYLVTLIDTMKQFSQQLYQFESNMKDMQNDINELTDVSIETNERMKDLPKPPTSLSFIKDMVRASVYKVGLPDGSGGTGFQILYKGKKYIITNAHVCDNEPIVKLYSQEAEGTGYRPVLKRDVQRDLCLIEGITSRDSIPVAKGLEVDDFVIVVGHPRGWSLTVTAGEVIDNHTTQPSEINVSVDKCVESGFTILKTKDGDKCYAMHPNIIRTTVEVLPGSSGSPLLNKKGQLVGIVYQYHLENRWASAIPLSHLKEFLEDVK